MSIKVGSERLEVRSLELKVGSLKLGTCRKKSILKTFLFVFCFLFFGISSNAQCAMCRAALTSEGNAVKAQAVNDGIVYLMVIPYVLVAGIGYYIYRMKKKKNTTSVK
jgi:hypothetical protein